MSMKVNKNGKEYSVGVIPQSLYDDVEDLKDAINGMAIKTKEVSGTTNADGLISLGISLPNIVVSCGNISSGDSYIVGNYNGDWHAFVVDATGNTLRTKPSISVRFNAYYI